MNVEVEEVGGGEQEEVEDGRVDEPEEEGGV